MPIYEYHCRDCRSDFEALVWTSREEQSVECPKCANKEVERILSPFARASSDRKDMSGSSCGPRTGGFS